MKKSLMILPLVFLLCITFGCQQAEEVAEEPAVDIAAEEAVIREANTAWAKTGEAKDVDKLMSFYAEDAVLIRNGVPSITDKATERENWSEWFSMGRTSTWQPEKVIIMDSGEYAYSYGVYHNEGEVEGEIRKSQGGYLAVWKKQVDGSWKIVALK